MEILNDRSFKLTSDEFLDILARCTPHLERLDDGCVKVTAAGFLNLMGRAAFTIDELRVLLEFVSVKQCDDFIAILKDAAKGEDEGERNGD